MRDRVEAGVRVSPASGTGRSKQDRSVAAMYAALRTFWIGVTPERVEAPWSTVAFLSGVGLGQRIGYAQGYEDAVEELETCKQNRVGIQEVGNAQD